HGVTQRSFLILHGVENWRPREHWQWWLARELRSRGEHVFYPQLPTPSSPALDEWLAVLHGDLAQLGSGERVVVAHRGGVALWRRNSPLRNESTASPSSHRPALPPSWPPIEPSCRWDSIGRRSRAPRASFRS